MAFRLRNGFIKPPVGYEGSGWKPWQGPEHGTVSYSMLCKWISCRHRCHLSYIQGWEEDQFRMPMHFGELWHAGEEDEGAGSGWKAGLLRYSKELHRRYPGASREIATANAMARALFPHYLQHFVSGQSILQEAKFKAPLVLPSGRVVNLTGIVDEVLKIKCGTIKGNRIFVKDNKTKERIDERGIQATLDQDLQLMLYMVGYNLSGIGPESYNCMYNIIRRPGSKPHKGESYRAYEKRLSADIKKRPNHYFHRWEVFLSEKKVQRFKERYLIPLLEQFWDWWEWVRPQATTLHPENYPEPPYSLEEYPDPFRKGNRIHWPTPWGVFNSMADGRRGDYFTYMTKGTKAAMTHKSQSLRYTNGSEEGPAKKEESKTRRRKKAKRKASTKEEAAKPIQRKRKK